MLRRRLTRRPGSLSLRRRPDLPVVYIQHDDGSEIGTVTVNLSGPDEEVVVRKADLLECVQVAVWRAGLLDGGTLDRLKSALELGKLDSVPKPPPKP